MAFMLTKMGHYRGRRQGKTPMPTVIPFITLSSPSLIPLMPFISFIPSASIIPIRPIRPIRPFSLF